VADLPFVLSRPESSARLTAAFDVEGKIPRALVAQGALEGSSVVVVGDAPSICAALGAIGARVSVLALPGDRRPAPDRMVAKALRTLPAASADAIVAQWSSFAGPSPASVAAADRVLPEGGRLLVLQDYGRDDLDVVRGPERTAELVAWSRRDGPYLRDGGFRIHVLHRYVTFATVEEAGDVLIEAFGERGAAVAAALRRPRLSWNVAIYHRVRPSP